VADLSSFCARLVEALRATGMDMVSISVTATGLVDITVTRPDQYGPFVLDVAIQAEGTVEMAECSDDALVAVVRRADHLGGQRQDGEAHAARREAGDAVPARPRRRGPAELHRGVRRGAHQPLRDVPRRCDLEEELMAEGKSKDAPCCTGYAIDGPEGCECCDTCGGTVDDHYPSCPRSETSIRDEECAAIVADLRALAAKRGVHYGGGLLSDAADRYERREHRKAGT
jgi:hypothetical protein